MLSDARLAELIEVDEENVKWADEHPTWDTGNFARDGLAAFRELAEARKLLQAALPHIRTCPGPTHHEDCACQVKRRIEALWKGEQ